MNKKRILLVEDDKMIGELFSNLLHHVGYEVDAAENSSVALRLYKLAGEQGNFYGAVLLDPYIPGAIDSIEFLRRLGEIDPKVKAIAICGEQNAPILSKLRNYGLKAIISQPFSIEEFIETLRNVTGDSNTFNNKD